MPLQSGEVTDEEFESLAQLAVATWRDMGVILKGGMEKQRKDTEEYLNRMSRIFPNHDFGPWTEAILNFSKNKCRCLHDVPFATSYIFNLLKKRGRDRKERARKGNEDSDELEDCSIVEEWGCYYLNESKKRYGCKHEEFKKKNSNNNNKRRRI